MHYKYVPDVMEKGEDPATNFTKPAIAYPTILPKWQRPDDYPYNLRIPDIDFCDGKVEFYKPEWTDMPTYYNVGVGLNSLVCKRVIGAKHLIYDEPCEYTTCYKLRQICYGEFESSRLKVQGVFGWTWLPVRP